MASTLMTSYLGQGLLAARPATPALAAGTMGLYYATDTQIVYRYAGGAWSALGSGVDLYAPPLAASFPTLIGGVAPSVTDTSYGMLFDSGATVAADAVRAALQPIANATNFTVTCGIRTNMIALPYRSLGLLLYDGTKFNALYQIGAGSLQVNYYNSLTSFGSAPLSLATGAVDQVYYRMQGDGTNIKYSVSKDGRNFIQIYSGTLGANLGTITKCGIGGNANANTTPPAVGDHMFADVFYWANTTP